MKLSIIITSSFMAIATLAPAIDTTSLQLRNGPTNDGAVSLTRDEDGNLFFDDAFTSPVSLSTLLESPTDHGALTGLADDDHTQYLNAARHEDFHDATFDNALPISGDANANQTIGEHVADEEIHLNRTSAEEITGIWNFTNGVQVFGNDASLGESQYCGDMALGFADGSDRAEVTFDSSDARFVFNRDIAAENVHVSALLNGRVASIRTAEIEGFATIEGIAATDLLSSTRQESVSEEWTFLDGVRTNRLTMTGYPSVVYAAKNLGAGSITAGTAVKWAGVDSGMLAVEALTSAISSTTPFAGIAITGGATGATIQVARCGVVDVPATGTFAIGDELTWDGSTITTSGTRIAFALQAHTGTANTLIMLSGNW